MSEKIFLEKLEAPLLAEIQREIEELRQLHSRLGRLVVSIKLRAEQSMVDASDLEIAAHETFLRSVDELLKDLVDKVHSAKERTAQRACNILISRGSDGFLALGHKFTPALDLIPSTPKLGSAERAALFDWLRASEWASSIREEIPWATLKKLCESRAERGEPAPPGVTLSTKATLRVRSVST